MWVSYASPVSAQPYSKVSVIIRPVGYLGVEYADPPSRNFPYVFFSSEQISVEIVMVNNLGTEPVRLFLNEKAIAANFAAKRPDGIDVALRLSTLVRRYLANETPVDLAPEFALEPKESLVLRAEIAAGQLTPGEHIVLLSTTIKDAAGLPLSPQVTRLVLEIRPSDAASALEEARRNAIRAVTARQFAAAETWIETLLRLHPRSYVAYVLRGEVAESSGDRGRARAAYQQAVSLLKSRADEHFLRRRRGGGEHVAEELIAALNQRIQANQDTPAK
jgi:hypothetical protein